MFFKRFDPQTLHGMVEFARDEDKSRHFFVVLSYEDFSDALGGPSPWKYHNTIELVGQYEVCVRGWSTTPEDAEAGYSQANVRVAFFFFVFRLPVLGDLLRFGFQKSHDGAADDDDDYWGSYGDAAEEVVTSQLPINYVQKLATSLSEQQSPLPQQCSSFAPSPLRTVASSVVEEGTGERSRSRSPEKRKLGQSDMMLDDYSGEDGHSNGGSPGAGVLGGDYGRTKRPILPSSLSTTTPQMSERDIMKALLKTNIQSLYGMARLSGITKAEFEEIVQKCCQ